ncbi:MAG: carbonic anhydrase family protein [Chitinophagaceae bacterium]|nr:carbonic anhydrase family protein [Chitinophagaceae bacterium]
MYTMTKEKQQEITPKRALEMLREGHARFMEKRPLARDYQEQIKETGNGQWPYAVVLSCIDSRTSIELTFDQGIGDIFSIRIAGNVVNEDILGSMEFACKVAGARFILVVGHTKCGAVKGACDQVEMGNLTGLLSRLKPAVDAETTITDNRNSSNPDFVEKVASLNVRLTVKEIMKRSPILKEMIDNGQVGIAGAMYHVESGELEIYEDTIING